jgi:hypothetical protein
MERTHLSRSRGGTTSVRGVPPAGGTPRRTNGYFFVTVICTSAVPVAPLVSVTVTLAV